MRLFCFVLVNKAKFDLDAWVRYLIGHEPGGGGPVYRICEISSKTVGFVFWMEIC